MSVLSATKILDDVLDYFAVRKSQLKSRSKQVALAKHTYMWLARKFTELGLQDIGMPIGGMDHTSVLHGINRIEEGRQKNKDSIRIPTDYFVDHYTMIYGRPRRREQPAVPGLAKVENSVEIASALNQKLTAEAMAGRIVTRLCRKLKPDHLENFLKHELGDKEGPMMLEALVSAAQDVDSSTVTWYATLATNK